MKGGSSLVRLFSPSKVSDFGARGLIVEWNKVERS